MKPAYLSVLHFSFFSAILLERQASPVTIALCLNCGNLKSGVLSPCPQCGVSSTEDTSPTGDKDTKIIFTDSYLRSEALEQLGAVVAALHAATEYRKLRYAAFLEYVSWKYPVLLHINYRLPLSPSAREAFSQTMELLRSTPLPPPVRNPLRREDKKPWWKFW